MADDLTFMMGKFAAVLPADLRYALTNHMWCRGEQSRHEDREGATQSEILEPSYIHRDLLHHST